MSVERKKSQFILFNKRALVLKMDRYDVEASPSHEGVRDEMKKYQAGSEEWNGTLSRK